MLEMGGEGNQDNLSGRNQTHVNEPAVGRSGEVGGRERREGVRQEKGGLLLCWERVFEVWETKE
jgi:hypothetical protein